MIHIGSYLQELLVNQKYMQVEFTILFLWSPFHSDNSIESEDCVLNSGVILHTAYKWILRKK